MGWVGLFEILKGANILMAGVQGLAESMSVSMAEALNFFFCLVFFACFV